MTANSTIETVEERVRAAERLLELGAHLVLCRGNYEWVERKRKELGSETRLLEWVKETRQKAPHQLGWRENPAEPDEVMRHVRAGGIFGIKPSSLDFAAVDIDHGGQLALVAVCDLLDGSPAIVLETLRTGGYHAVFHNTECHGNAKWRIPEGSGEIRGDAGFIALWQPSRLADAMERNDTSLPVSLAPLVAAAPNWEPTSSASTHDREPDYDACRRVLDDGDPDEDYDDWIRRLMAVHYESNGSEEGFRLALEWSSRGRKFRGEDEIRAKWASFGRYGGAPVTLRSFMSSEMKLKGADETERLREFMRQEGWSVQYNTLAAQREFRRGGAAWAAHKGRVYEGMLRARARQYKAWVPHRDEAKAAAGEGSWKLWKPAMPVFEDALDQLALERESNPVLEYLDSLPRPDGHPEDWQEALWDVTSVGLGLEDTPLNRWAAVSLWVGAVQWPRNPGGKPRILLVLKAPMGTGKSTFLTHMAPAPLRRYCQTISYTDNTERMIHRTTGTWIGEIADMAGMGRAERGKLKAWLTAERVAYSPKYARDTHFVERDYHLIATTDTDLPDEGSEGSSRFLPVICNAREGEQRWRVLDREGVREHAWACAAWLEREGFNALHLTNELREEHKRMVERESIPPGGERFHHLASVTDYRACSALSVLYRTTVINSHPADDPPEPRPLSPPEEKAYAAALRNLKPVGFTTRRIRVNGKQTRVWIGPENEKHPAYVPPQGASEDEELDF